MSGIPGLSDGPQAATPDLPVVASAGPRFDQPPERPAEGPSTFLVVKNDTCQFCQQTMKFLEALHEARGDFQVAVLDVNQQQDAFKSVVQHTRRTTVPQIFLDGRLVGGWDELVIAAKKGKLDAYLDGEEWRSEEPKRRWFRQRA